MLGGKELEIAKKTLDEVTAEANKAGDKEVYRFNFTPQNGDLGYGNEGTKPNEGFDYATENHYYSYASITARTLDAQHWVVARSGIGAYGRCHRHWFPTAL